MIRLLYVLALIVLSVILNVAAVWLLAAFHGTNRPLVLSHQFTSVSNALPEARLESDDWLVLILEMRAWTRVVSLSNSQAFRPADLHASLMISAFPYRYVELPDMDLPRWSRVVTGDHENLYSLIEDAYGWPMRSFSVRFQVAPGGQPAMIGHGVPLTITNDPASAWSRPRVLPVTPIWSGLVVNVAILAGALAVLRGLFRLAKMRWRIRRGQCARCGYELRGLVRCPECGLATKPATQLAAKAASY